MTCCSYFYKNKNPWCIGVMKWQENGAQVNEHLLLCTQAFKSQEENIPLLCGEPLVSVYIGYMN